MNPSATLINLNDTRYNILPEDWTSCITDQNDIFYYEPTILKIICNILNQYIHFTTFVFSNLNTRQRHHVYYALSYFKFVWKKSVDSNGATTIWLDFPYGWNIPSQPIWNTIRSPTKKLALENLYNSITNIRNAPNGDIYVNMDDFVKYHIINNKYYNDSNTFYRATPQYTTNNTLTNNTLTDNTTKKLQLSDMIFDIKDDITDLMFKTIMDKLAEL